MPALTTLSNWLALLILAILLTQSKQATRRRIQRICFALMRHHEGANMLFLVATLPGLLLSALTHWLVASLLNERAEWRGWRLANARIDAWPSPFLVLTAEIPIWKRTFLQAAQIIVGIALLSWLTAEVTPLYSALIGRDLEQFLQSGQYLLITPGFWLWAYLTFTISLTMLPISFHRNLPWFIAGLTGVLLASFLEWGAPASAIPFTTLQETLARSLLSVLVLQSGFLIAHTLSQGLFQRLRRRLVD